MRDRIQQYLPTVLKSFPVWFTILRMKHTYSKNSVETMRTAIYAHSARSVRKMSHFPYLFYGSKVANYQPGAPGLQG